MALALRGKLAELALDCVGFTAVFFWHVGKLLGRFVWLMDILFEME